jgi:hypothetical protein
MGDEEEDEGQLREAVANQSEKEYESHAIG